MTKNQHNPLVNLLSDPAHIIAARLFIKAFGSFKAKSYFNVLPRGGYAYGLLRAAEFAILLNKKCFTAVEFGVASGEGLDLLCKYAKQVERITGLHIDVVGYDTGGLPESRSWKDHPEMWSKGDYTPDVDLNIKFLGRAIINPSKIISPIMFASVDVDYYSSTVEVLDILHKSAATFASVYFDDIEFTTASNFRGELCAINEFNKGRVLAHIDTDKMLPGGRLLRYAGWYKHMYVYQKEA